MHLIWILACTSSTGVIPAPVEDSGEFVDSDPVELEPQLWINEFMADNGGSLTDPTGANPDWIELYNPGAADLQLEGWWISDDEDDPRKQVLQELVVPAGGHLVLYADGAPDLGPEHLDFALSDQGEHLRLHAPDGRLVDFVDFPAQAPDVAAARSSDGAGTWLLSAEPSPGEENPPREVDPPSVDDGRLCQLSSSPEPAWFTEGDTVELELGCLGELSLDEAETSLVRAPEGLELEGSALSWATELDDAALEQVVIGLRPEGATDRVPEAALVPIWLADAHDAEGNSPVDPLTYTEEWGLPVVHLEPSGEITQSYVDATVTLNGQVVEGEMKIRGASSASFPKPSFTLAFRDEEILLPGWERSRERIVLLSTFDDNSYVRQKLIYDLWEQLEAFGGEARLAPHTEFAVVYLEGSYHGLYVLLDHVDDEWIAHEGLNKEGNLYKAVNHDANFYLTASNGSTKSSLGQGYEKKEGDEEDWSDLEELVGWTGSVSSAELVTGGELLDPLEFSDWFLLVHYTLAEDSAGKNSYLYNDPESPGFRFVPWDFNHAWGQNWYTARTSSSSLNHYEARNRVFWALQNDAAAEAALWERFDELRAEGGPFDLAWQLAQLDAYYAAVEPAARRDWAKWEDNYRSHWWADYRSDWTSYEEEKAYVYAWVEERAAVFDEDHP